MTERKPPRMETQDWVEAQIKQAQAGASSTNLRRCRASRSRSWPIRTTPDWWVKDFIRREKIEADVLLPPIVQLRKEKARSREKVATMRTETEVRDYLEDLNKRILLQIRDATGVVIPVGKTDEDAVLREWREDRDAFATAQPESPPAPEPAKKRSLWQRLFS